MFKTRFKLNSKLIAIIFICYKYKYPLAYFLTLYEMYKEASLFAFKAFSCNKKIELSNKTFIQILEESRDLYHQILAGQSMIIKMKNEKSDTIVEPKIDVTQFSPEFRFFIENYLLKNMSNIFDEEVELTMTSDELYSEITL